jgi:hypothetical protein
MDFSLTRKVKVRASPLHGRSGNYLARDLIKTIIENNGIKHHLQLRSVHLAMALLTYF